MVNKKKKKGYDLKKLPTKKLIEEGTFYKQEVELYDYGLGTDIKGKPKTPSIFFPRAKKVKNLKKAGNNGTR
tara:strand:+ start:4634 stop:4849 length:216 start_codon:yes stop_codon:yes gene_type:complete